MPNGYDHGRNKGYLVINGIGEIMLGIGAKPDSHWTDQRRVGLIRRKKVGR